MPAPDYEPQLATLVKSAPDGREWLHEIKYDGYRIGCRIRGGRVRLISRNGKDWTSAFPEIAEAASALGAREALLDGEVAVVLPDGRTSFQALQNAFRAESAAARAALTYFAFDLLHVDGERLDRLPLDARKQRLRALLGRPKKHARIRYSDHVEGGGAAFFREACRAGLEGIISKQRGEPYHAGRSDAWLKTKCTRRQEFTIGGFTDPEGARVGIGALLVGYYDASKRLVFAGKVGTGFTHQTALDLRRRLEAIEQRESPFAERLAGGLPRRAHWVAPVLVGEVEFTEWTDEGKIRHPSFQGLREDKRPLDVRREEPVARPAARAGAPALHGVAISHPERIVYPEARLTKLHVARYYDAIATWIVPHVRGRPLTLVRCPEGLRSGCFFMKHSKVWAPAPLRRVRIQEKTKLGDYLIADDVAGVIGLVQMGVLEIHTWNSDFARVEQPNRIVFDLDPGEHVPFAQVVEGARVVRSVLRSLGLESFVKTTGGAGLHVVVPLVPHAEWDVCLAFTRALAETIVRSDPEVYTTDFAKRGRERKILVDYLRNNRTNTSVAAFSTRAKPGATVSLPITWRELKPALDPSEFTVMTVPKRLSRLRADPWADYWTTKQKLSRAILKAVGV